jgi:hypothetical protein
MIASYAKRSGFSRAQQIRVKGEKTISANSHDFPSADEQVDLFIDRLKDDRDMFPHVFKTKNGSTYFVTPDQASLRIKETISGIERIQPVMRCVVFIDPEIGEEILQSRGTLLYEAPLPLSQYAIGNTPLEIGNENTAPDGFEISDTHLIMRSAMPLHIGHTISAVER